MGCGSAGRIKLVLDQSESHIDVSAVAQYPTDLTQGAKQLAAFADTRFGKKNAQRLLKAPAPNPSVMNGVRLVADQDFGEQGDEFFEPELGNGEKFFIVRVGFLLRLDCAHDRLVFHSIAQLA